MVGLSINSNTVTARETRSFLSLFEPCVVHIINYHSLDLHWLKLPAVLEKHYTAWTSSDHFGTGKLFYYKTVVYQNSTDKTKWYLQPDYPPKLAFKNWYCTVHTFLYPPKRESFYEENYLGRRLVIPNVENFFAPTNGNFNGENSGTHLSKSRYYLLVTTHKTVKDPSTWVTYWSIGVHQKTNVGFNRLVVTLSPSYEIHELFGLCQFCESYRYKLIPIQNNIASLAAIAEALQVVNSINIGVPWLIHNHRLLGEERQVQHWKIPRSESTKKFQSKLHDINHVIFRTVVINSTLWRNPYKGKNEEYHFKYTFAPRVQFNDDSFSSVLLNEKESFKFITCDGVIQNSVSFVAYISAFDLMTWIALLNLCILTAIVHFIALNSPYPLRKRPRNIKLATILENMFRILLEQGDIIVDKVVDRFSVFVICLSWILMGIILTNAYKGNNIRELSAPKGLEFIDTFEKLVAANFTIFSYPMSLVEPLYRNISYGQMHLSPDQRVFYEERLQKELKFNEEHSELGQELHVILLTLRRLQYKLEIDSNPNKNELVKAKAKLGKQIDQYKRVYDITQIPYEYGNGITPFIKVLDCSKNAYGDWSHTIEIMKLKMEKKMPSRWVIKSAGGLVTRTEGWKLQNYFDEGIVTRMRLLYEGGIVQMWVKLENYNKLLEISMLKENKETTEEKLGDEKPKVLALEHNLSSIFLIQITLAAGSLLLFALEHAFYEFFTPKRLKTLLQESMTFLTNRRKNFSVRLIIHLVQQASVSIDIYKVHVSFGRYKNV